jgi:transcriptional regulator with XRE-family HTH domain
MRNRHQSAKARLPSIKELRRHAGLSSSQLAHLLGVTQSTALRFEQAELRGAITIKSLEKIAQALGCSFSYEFSAPPKRRRSRGTYSGLRRGSRTKVTRRTRSVNDTSEQRNLLLARALAPSARILQACALADLGMKIGKSPRARSNAG